MSNSLAAMAPPMGRVGVGARDREELPDPMQHTLTLPGLIERLRRKDDTALEAFIAQTRGLAYRLAWSMLQDAHRCEDVLQDVYLTVYQKIDQLREVRAFRTWFCRIVVNRCRRLLREQRPDSLDEILESGGGPYTSEMAERVQDRLEVSRAVSELIEQDRVVLTLREVFDMSYHEIAESLDIPVGTVRSRLSKARLRLMTALQGLPPEGGRKGASMGIEGRAN